MQKSINWQTWACQLFFGYPLGSSAHFLGENISKGSEKELPIPSIVLPKKSSSISAFSQAVSSSVELLLESVNSDLQKYSYCEPVVFLSGGWDSRAILCALHRVNPNAKVRAYTTSYDAGNNQEQTFAANVANVLNVPHRIFSLSERYYQECAHHALESSNFTTKMHIWMQDFLRQIKLPENTVNFDGYAGDLLFRGMRQELGDETLSPDDPSFFQRFAVLRPEKVLTSSVYKTLETLARDALTKELSLYPAETRVLNFLLNNRGARGVAHSIGLQLQHINVALPFLNEDLIHNSVNIEPAIRLDQRFYPAILEALNSKVASLPSTNTKNLPDDSYNETLQIKYQPENLDWIYSNIKKASNENQLAGGLLDWYTLNPNRKLNQELEGRDRKQFLRVLEMLNLYAIWYNRNKENIKPNQNILKDLYQYDSEKTTFVARKDEHAFDETIQKYLEEIKTIKDPNTLLFNLTMDVEAFGIDDFYSNHTTDKNVVERLIYSDFGKGSDIENLLMKNKVPCTYFIESYSKQWQNEQMFSDAVRFFDKPFSEVGLHCHAFSLPANITKELDLSFAWNMRHEQLTKVLSWGKQRMEAALSNRREVSSYRSGRLDIYPDMELALINSGFKIDSSLLDGVDSFYYQKRSTNFGNGIFNFNGITQVPITGFRADKRIRSLDFNGATFEEICDVIVQAIKQGLPCLTLIMHSWSFSKVCQLNDFGKMLHYDSDPILLEKLEKLLEFINATPMVRLSTVSNTAKELKPYAAGDFPATNINTKPTLLTVNAWREGERIYASSVVNFDRVPGEIEYAFYLLKNGEKIDAQMYKSSNTTYFVVNHELSCEDIVVRGYIRNIGDKKPLLAKSTLVQQRDYI